MSVTPEISIIMANYNGARYLPAAIQSVIRQRLTSWELLIVDDASTDKSVIRATEAAAGDPRIQVVAQFANRGPAAARNRALDMAAGRWFAIVDSDDLMLPHRLQRLLQRAKTDAATIVADNLLIFSEGTRPRPFLTDTVSRDACWINLTAFIASNNLYSRSPDLGYLKPMIRMDVVRRLGLRYDETLRIGEDYDFLARLMAHGHRLRLEPNGLYLYRKHAASISHRLRAADITALLDATNRFARHVPAFPEPVAAALNRRCRSLKSLLVYDKVIGAIQHGNLAGATKLALAHPHMWPLLARPVAARLNRMAAKLPRPRAGFASPSASSELEALLLWPQPPAHRESRDDLIALRRVEDPVVRRDA